jgi:dTMP kinase
VANSAQPLSFINVVRFIRNNRGCAVVQELVQKKTLKKGILIAIEGIDGAGKTTQSRLLYERIKNNGYSTILLHEPTDGQWGKKIRELAINGRNKVTAEEELELFYRDRLEDVDENICPNIEKKSIVIMDRYYFSSVAYQGANGLNLDYVEKRNKEIAPIPDMLIILDIPPSESIRRIRATRADGPNHFEQAEYLEKVRGIFLNQFNGRPYVAIIDGDGRHSEEQISDSLWSLVEPLIREFEES